LVSRALEFRDCALYNLTYPDVSKERNAFIFKGWKVLVRADSGYTLHSATSQKIKILAYSFRHGYTCSSAKLYSNICEFLLPFVNRMRRRATSRIICHAYLQDTSPMCHDHISYVLTCQHCDINYSFLCQSLYLAACGSRSDLRCIH